jgi:CelD/BcsL family acetyltransferase involved in cellulose biosynthesis
VGNAYSQARAILHNTSHPDTRRIQAELLFRYFMQHVSDWDFIDLYGLQMENGNYDQMKQAAACCGLRIHTSVAYGNCFQDNIFLSAEDFMQTKSSKVRKNVPYYQRKMRREGTVQFRLVQESERLDIIMDRYYALYAKSWKEAERIGPNFHRDLAKLAAEKGWLRLGFLEFNTLPIACQFWLVEGATAYILKSFYDEAFKHFSPGTVLSEFMIRNMIEQDHVSGIDYLQGEEPYKHDWVSDQRKRKRVVIYNTNLGGRILFVVNRFREIKSRMASSIA